MVAYVILQVTHVNRYNWMEKLPQAEGPISTIGSKSDTVTISNAGWRPCEVDPAAGRAEFDGLVIEADPMTWPGLERVLPIFEEEQVFMCRSMDAIIAARPGAAALDVGTGCGVFAIWAARRGCRVIGIDINPRAIHFATRNASRNGVRVVNSRADLVDGSIFFDVCRFDESFVEQEPERFDFIFLNPPYNPTAPGVVVAMHADAGQDGQGKFRQQINLVPRLLSVHGVCIGNQMGLMVDCLPTQHSQTLREIRHAFHSSCHVRFTRMMEEGNDKPVEQFLRDLYLPLARNGLLPVATVEEYINATSRNCAKFALFYYEVSRQPSWEASYFLPSGRPDTTWTDRLWIHRCILQTAEFPKVTEEHRVST
jgi:hypothetical protein